MSGSLQLSRTALDDRGGPRTRKKKTATEVHIVFQRASWPTRWMRALPVVLPPTCKLLRSYLLRRCGRICRFPSSTVRRGRHEHWACLLCAVRVPKRVAPAQWHLLLASCVRTRHGLALQIPSVPSSHNAFPYPPTRQRAGCDDGQQEEKSERKCWFGHESCAAGWASRQGPRARNTVLRSADPEPLWARGAEAA